MASEGYELLSLFMRYIFIGLGVLILLRAFRWMRKDSRAYKKQIRALPDAGLVGEMVNLQTGKSQPLPREGIIGSARNCDIRIKGAGVARKHALFAFEEGKGMKITPVRRAIVFLAGVELRGSAHALHGTQLQVGDAMLRVRLFTGLNVPHPAQFQMDLPEQPDMDDDTPWDASALPVSYMSPFAPPQEEDEYPNLQQPFMPLQPEYAELPVEENIPAPPAQNPVWQNFENDSENNAEWMQPNGSYAACPPDAWQRQPAFAQTPYPPMGIQAEEDGEDEALPYQSPVVRRRRRSRQ